MNKIFGRRVVAFLIDVIILYLFSTVVTAFVPTFGDIQEYTSQLNDVLEEMTKEDVNEEQLIQKTNDIAYNVSKATYLYQITTITIYILYFVVYQKKKNGQTIGKRKMKIVVKKKDNSELRYDDLLKRGSLLYGFLTNIIMLGVLLFASKSIYFATNNLLIYVQYAIFIVCILTTAFKGVGLHDKFANTVVEEC